MLREALTSNPDRTGELNRYLATTYFLQPDPDLAAALEAANRYLASKDATEDGRSDALLLRAEILILLKRPADALTDINKTPADSKRAAEALVLRARCLLAEAIAARGKDDLSLPPTPEVQNRLIQALTLIDEALDRDRGLTVATPRASYVAGLIELQRNFLEAADENFRQSYRRSVDGPEGAASQLQSARLARIRKRTQAAVDLYREVLDEVGDAVDYHNRWLSLTEVKKEFVAAFDDFFAKQEFAAAATLAESFPKLFDEDYAVQLAAESNVAWGKQLGDVALDGPGETSETGEQARVRYRMAGKLYERLAELRQATREYPEEIWSSANNYLKGAAYADAARQFRRYIEVEPRSRHAEALIGLAEVLFVNQRHEQSFVLLKQSLDLYPRDPSTFRARLLLAHIYSELNQWEQAERTLRDNLESEALTPESEEWRRSLFALGRMLYDVGRYRDAADRLDESVERYPEDVETVEARYRAAESHRRIAQSIELEIPTDALPAERAKFVHRAETEYDAALARFDDTIRIARGPHRRGLDDASRNSMLRNSLFARGSILHAVGRYDDAIRAHQTAIASFPNSPAALDAYLQIVDCYRRLRRGPEARGTLEQAKLMLNRLPQDASFESVSNYTRQEWAKLLDTLGSF
jgi:tetratricopeptide (TPR) repeat protein